MTNHVGMKQSPVIHALPTPLFWHSAEIASQQFFKKLQFVVWLFSLLVSHNSKPWSLPDLKTRCKPQFVEAAHLNMKTNCGRLSTH